MGFCHRYILHIFLAPRILPPKVVQNHMVTDLVVCYSTCNLFSPFSVIMILDGSLDITNNASISHCWRVLCQMITVELVRHGICVFPILLIKDFLLETVFFQVIV